MTMSELLKDARDIEQICEYRICQCREYVDTDLDNEDECCNDFFDDCDCEEVYIFYW